eukprot:2557768-Amphidinium_carterae.1
MVFATAMKHTHTCDGFRQRPPTETPNGLFSQNWPVLEEPEELSPDVTKAKILAALVMEDNDH